MNDVNAIFEQLKKIQPQAIILFGSQARGEAKKDSDMDILLIKKTNQSFSDRMREIRSRIRTKIALDLIVLTPEEVASMRQKSTFFSQIFKEGKIIYGRI